MGNVETLGKEDKVRWLDTDGAIDNDGTALVDGADMMYWYRLIGQAGKTS